MKKISFLGDSLGCIRELPRDIRQDIGFQLDKVQNGNQPNDFKPMPSIGRGVEEIRVRGEDGAYRVIYTARIVDVVYVLHAFKRKHKRHLNVILMSPNSDIRSYKQEVENEH